MSETNTKPLYKKLGYEINGILFEVHNELGRFAKEKQYANLMEIKLKGHKLPFKRECTIGDSGNIVDFIIKDLIILELKAKPFLLRSDYDQVKRYLQVCRLKLGILVNFRNKFLQPKRILSINN